MRPVDLHNVQGERDFIRTKKIIAVRSWRPIIGELGCLSIIVIIAGILFLTFESPVSIHSRDDGIDPVKLVPILIEALGLFFALRRSIPNRRSVVERALGAEVREKFPTFIGSKPQYIDTTAYGYRTNIYDHCATGFAYADGRLFVLNGGIAAEIPWNMIRSWAWTVDGYDETVLYGRHGGIAAMSNARDNEVARERAARESGFTVTVTDIEKPEWRLQSTDTTILKKMDGNPESNENGNASFPVRSFYHLSTRNERYVKC